MTTLLLPLFVLGSTANILGAVPQARRTVLQRQTDGLSPLGLRAGLLMNAAWLAYSVSSGNLGLTLLNGVTTALCAANVLAHRTHHSVKPGMALEASTLVLLTLWGALTLTGSQAALSQVAVVLGFLVGLPQLATLLLHPASTKGVAAGSYLIGSVGGLAWSVYWGLQANPFAATGALYGGVVALTGLVLLRGRHVITRALARRQPSLHHGLRVGAARARVLLPAG
ncbi:hypothetical protein [Motilibacter aurantiacus]|uniref:hypothetical protein n=1 Tax=Motilibacter aurantiacus TaxID=2714955 RepID=UPI00140DEBD6|nr:hypothetical protein [Motilibacter aurantiacus]NHC46978.1 hypothetical protein [Motilibacter aurantiacus]